MLVRFRRARLDDMNPIRKAVMNYLSVDGEPVENDGMTEDVTLTFPEDYDGERETTTDPATWCNAAGISINDDNVRVWISTGDPRGGFQMEIRRTDDGRMYVHVPHAGESMPHEDTVEIHPGTLAIEHTLTPEMRKTLGV